MKTDWCNKTWLRETTCDALNITEIQRMTLIEREYPKLQQEWLNASDPTYLLPLYSEVCYAVTTTECFINYTQHAVRKFCEWNKTDTGLILDLGGGMGASSRLLAELTKQPVVYHAYSTGAQTDIAESVLTNQQTIICENEVDVIRETKPNVVVAFELFEHIKNPVPIIKAISENGVKVLCCANSFGALDFGHWPTYQAGSGFFGTLPRQAMGRFFGKTLRELGWTKVQTGFWNNRPTIWIRK